MIQARVKAGMERAKPKGTKSGKAIGRPRLPEATLKAIKRGLGMRALAKQYGVSLGTVQAALV